MTCTVLAAVLAALELPAPKQSWRTGMMVLDMSDGRVLAEICADQYFRPASTMKLVTTLFALEVLGPSHVYETQVLADTTARSIFIVGAGAPLVQTGEIARAAVETAAMLDPSASWSVFYDTGCFMPETHLAGWEDEDWNRAYCPPVEALPVGDNLVEIVVSTVGGQVRALKWPDLPGLEIETRIAAGSEALSASAMGWDGSDNSMVVSGSMPGGTARRIFAPFAGAPSEFALMFSEELAANGIEIEEVGPGNAPDSPGLRTVSEIRSDELSSILCDMNKWSMNGVAEQVLRTAGLAVTGEPATTAAACDLAGAMLRRLTPGCTSFQLADGSGLSRLNRLSPSNLAAVVAAGASSMEWGPEFLASLAVNGVDGTLRSRLSDLPPGAFRGKTGTLSDTCTLAGVVSTSSGRRLAVAILAETPSGDVLAAKAWQDDVIRALYRGV